MSKHAFRILAICTVVAVIAATWAVQQEWSRWGANENGTKLFPGFADNLSSVARVKLRHRDREITLEHRPDGWVVLESDGFPARSKSIQDLLFAFSETRRLEPKTQETEKYAKLQVEDPLKPDAESKLIEVLDKNENSLAKLILGKENLLLQAIGEGGAYIRLPDRKQTWLASGNLIASVEIKDWLNNPVFDIPRQRFEEATLNHPNGDTVTVKRSPKSAGTFLLEGLADDEKLISDYYPSDIARALEKFEIHGARKRDKIDFPADKTIQGAFRAVDGLTIEFELATVDGKDWLRINSATTPPGQSAEADAEARGLAERTKDWVFLVPEFESIHLKKNRAQVVEKAKPQS